MEQTVKCNKVLKIAIVKTRLGNHIQGGQVVVTGAIYRGANGLPETGKEAVFVRVLVYVRAKVDTFCLTDCVSTYDQSHNYN